jgi:hypothetical protein
MNSRMKQTQIGLLAVALATLGAVTARAAVAPPAHPKLSIRALSPQDIKDYGLTGKQGSSGLSTIGVGQPAYLEILVPNSVSQSGVLNISWSLVGKPIGSETQLGESPLGANVPAGVPSDRQSFWLGSRRMLKPDLEGTYTISAAFTFANGVSNLTQKITAARYLGYDLGCKACHSGGLLAQNMSSFTNTGHATALQRKLDDSTGHLNANCVSCHSVGFDTNPDAVNGGFDDVAKELGWVFPATLTNGNWAAMPSKLKNVANVQCESCHGPGSQHLLSGGIVGNTDAISVTYNSATCGQCHDSKTHHIKNPEWANSRHAVVTASPTGPGREGCVGCHTGKGYVAKLKGVSPLPTQYEAIGCAACHDPHAADNPHQLRVVGDIKLLDNKTVIKNAGKSAICMSCHLSRRDAVTYVETTAGGSTFGPHYSTQADMLAGANAITYGKNIPSSAHSSAVHDGCVHCHMQPVAANQPGFTQVGGHTFSLALETSTNRIELVSGCRECHGDIKNFNLARQDYDGNGVIEGVQTEVKNLMAKLALLLPPVGVAKSTISISSSWTKQQLRAGFNYKFVEGDGSFGVHNAAYTVGILKASIADLTGDANTDGLPDAWQIQYFGSASAANAAPNATPAGDGVPNWLKYTLGLDPRVAGLQVPGGVVWASGKSIGGSADNIQIYTAAEVAFNTETGKNYQLQAISTLGGGWSNIGQPLQGTGSAMSFVTPTRANTQQFFRVVSNP